MLSLSTAIERPGVSRVDADLEGLQPVAVPQALEGEGVRAGRGEAVERREGRLLAGFAEPAEQDAALLQHRVAALLDALAQPGS